MHDGVDTAAILGRLAALAGRVAGMSSVTIRCGDAVQARHGTEVEAAQSSVRHAFRTPTNRDGSLELTDARHRGPLAPSERASLEDLAAVISAVLAQDRQATLLAEAVDRAVRADLMLRLVTEAPSCTGALTGLLEELCHQHGACVGRIWRLQLDGSMVEESRFNATGHDALPYYHMPAAAPVRAGNSWTAQAIMRNEPLALIYSKVTNPEQFVLMGNAMAAGLASQVSFPFWLAEERFGVSLAFSTERDDLQAVVDDIASLANTIRPALFRKVAEDRVLHLAHHDGLTQLGNRIAFNERLQDQIQCATGNGGRFALLYLDLDGFKAVNDTFGHDTGDRLLVMVAQRLRACVPDGERIARLGGDEFAIVLPASATDAPALSGTALAHSLLDRFKEPFVMDGRSATVGVSVGIACFPAHGATPDRLLRSADMALYECKRSGRRSFRVFDAKLGAEQRSRSAMREELEAALEAGQFGAAFQPICKASDRCIQGLEALLHWRHPRRGVLALPEFLHAVDAVGLAMPVGRWMLGAACQAAAAWTEPWILSVNVLPGQVRHPGLLAQIEAVLKETGLPPERLDIEVAESLLVAETGLAQTGLVQALHAIRELGVRVTLDGFGTSHAGLGWLRHIVFDRIKLDPSCVADLRSPGTLALVHSVLSLGRHLGVEVVAEGVETDAELEAVAVLGFQLVQGGLTGRPDTASAYVDAHGRPFRHVGQTDGAWPGLHNLAT